MSCFGPRPGVYDRRVANCDFRLVAAEFHKPSIRIDRYIDFGMLFPKQIEPRYQQGTRERGLDADPKQTLCLFSNDLRQPPVDVVETDGQLIEQGSARLVRTTRRC